MKLLTVSQLVSVNSVEKIQALNTAGIFTIRDMAEFDGCRHAELIMAYSATEQLQELDLENYIEVVVDESYLLTIGQASMKDMISITDEVYEAIHTAFDTETIGELALFAPYLEARELVKNNILGAFYEKPSAPQALLPKIIGSTHTQVRFCNYVKEKEQFFDGYELNFFADTDEPIPPTSLIEIFYQSTSRFYLGYLGSVQQKWINMGTHLGEPIHSIALAPGESRNIAVIDWYRRQQSSRKENTTVDETLTSEFVQTRALNEVVQSTANEHLAGGTEIDANTKTTGYGLVGGLGGGSAKGGSNTTNTSASLMGPLYGMLVGGALESVTSEGALSSTAGSLGASLVHSKGTVQGTLKSETSGEREVMGEVVQNINDATIQNSSNVRSIMSTVVVEDRQSGRQKAQTKNITNYNHSHALTMQYYEVLQTYRTKTVVDTLTPVLFLPFKPIAFDIELIQEYWYLLGKAIKKTHPKKFVEYNQVVKDFNPENDAFDATGNVRIKEVNITKSKNFTSNVRVELYDASPIITLAISGTSLNEDVDLNIKGSAVYVTLNVLSSVANSTYTEFNGADSFEIDENITIRLASSFKTELEETMKLYLGDEDIVPKAETDANPEDNEIGALSNRNKLKQQVDDGKYKLLNGSEELELTFDIAYTLVDENDQEQVVTQTLNLSYTFNDLYNGFDREVFNVTDFVNTQLTTIADINPTDVIAEIEDHFRFHKYTYTKYLLANLEKEQVMDIAEHLSLAGGSEVIPLTSFIDPNPLGITENFLIFKLKDGAKRSVNTVGEKFDTVIKSDLFDKKVEWLGGNGFKKSTIKDGKNMLVYQLSAQSFQTGKHSLNAPVQSTKATLYVQTQPNPEGLHEVKGTIDIFTVDKGITRRQPVSISGTTKKITENKLSIKYQLNNVFGHSVNDVLQGDFDVVIHYPEQPSIDIHQVIKAYTQSVNQYEEQMRARPEWATVFLPTAGVFGEAILGISNASEYINIKRFYHWIDSPIPNAAPGIQPVNANQDYSQPIPDSLQPNVPVSVLNQMNPVPFPATSLNTALQAVQNGQMFADMSKSGQLVSALGTLAQLANNTAQLSGNLAGNAAANSLQAAVELGKQVAAMLGPAMSSSVNTPPPTQTAIGGALGLLDTLSPSNPTPNEQAQANATGTPIPVNNGTSSGGSGGTPPGGGTTDPGTSTVLFDQVEMKVESVEITGGDKLSDSLIEFLNVILGLFQVIPDVPDWVLPEIGELFRPYSTLEIKGTMTLRDPLNGLVAEQKNFTIKSTDAFAIIKNESGHLFDKFNTYNIPLVNPIYSLCSLDGTETISAFANVDPVSAFDFVFNTIFAVGTGGLASILGVDEINVGGWVFSLAEYSALISNAVYASNNSYSQQVEYFTNLRESWTERDLLLYINNKSDGFQYIHPVHPVSDICLIIPTSPPDLILH